MNRKYHHLSPPSASQVDTSQLAAANHGKSMLWLATALVALALTWPVIVPFILDR